MSIKRKKLFSAVVSSLFLMLSVSVGAEVRFWHDRSGNEFRAEFSKSVFGNIYLRGMDGEVFPVAATNLIDSDLDYIRSLTPPKIEIKFSKKMRQITDFPSEYDSGRWDDHQMEVTGLVTVKKMGTQPYSGTLRGEVYLIGEEVETDDYRLFAKKGFAVAFPGETAEFQFQLKKILRYYSMSGNVDRGAHYKGYVVIIDDPDGNRLAFKTNLFWIKEDNLNALRKIPCPGFFDEDLKKRPVPRPKDFRSPGSGSY